MSMLFFPPHCDGAITWSSGARRRGTGLLRRHMQCKRLFSAGILLVQLVVDAVGHARAIVLVAVVGQHEPGPLRERHRQITHVAAMLDFHGQRLVVDRLAAQGPEEIGQRRLHAGFRSSSQKIFSARSETGVM